MVVLIVLTKKSVIIMNTDNMIDVSKKGVLPYEDCFDKESKDAIELYFKSLPKYKILTLMARPKRLTKKLMSLVTEETRKKIEKQMRRS